MVKYFIETSDDYRYKIFLDYQNELKAIASARMDNLIPEGLANRLSDDDYEKLTSLLYDNKTIYMDSIVIYEEYRGKGYLKGIMDAIESYFRDRDILRLILIPYPIFEEKSTENIDTLVKIYERCGFSIQFTMNDELHLMIKYLW